VNPVEKKERAMTSQRVDQPEPNDPSEAPSETGQSPPPPPDDDLGEILARRPSRHWSLPSFTASLIGLVVILGVFLGGVLIGKHAGASSTAPSSQNGLPGGAGNVPGGGPGGGGALNPGSGFAAGTVTRVEGDTVYVQMADGTTIKVVTDGSTQIRVTQTGSVSDLATGSTVVVQGTASDNGGTITANTITEGTLGRFPGGLNGPGAPSPSPSSG
jgi:hypothetical protein